MYKYRLFLGISAVSLLLMGLAFFNPFAVSSRVSRDAASDFDQRHPDWIWTVNRPDAVIPITGDAAFPDYYQRHPDLYGGLAALGSGASDYFERHRELIPANTSNVDLTDYYFRHPELSASAAQASIDLTDYYFRHINDK